MKTRAGALVVAALVALFCSQPVSVGAQTSARIYRIGYLAPVPDGLPPFRQALRELGYEEGRNLKLEEYLGHPERLPALATELVRANVDVVLASSPPAIRAAKDATTVLPIVMVTGIDPVTAKFVESYNRPGGNVTGVSMLAETLVGKRVELLTQLVPNAKRVAILAADSELVSGPQVATAQAAARKLGLETVIVRVGSPVDYDTALAEAARDAQGVLLLAHPMFMRDRNVIARLAAKHRVRMVCDWEELVQAGCLAAYGPSVLVLMRSAARFVDRVLRGASPAVLPVEQADTFDLTLNLATAEALGVKVPESVRQLAARSYP